MNIIETKGIVLSSLKYGDTSLIVRCYTEKYGIKSFIAKGVFSKKKRNSALYFPLNEILCYGCAIVCPVSISESPAPLGVFGSTLWGIVGSTPWGALGTTLWGCGGNTDRLKGGGWLDASCLEGRVLFNPLTRIGQSIVSFPSIHRRASVNPLTSPRRTIDKLAAIH